MPLRRLSSLSLFRQKLPNRCGFSVDLVFYSHNLVPPIDRIHRNCLPAHSSTRSSLTACLTAGFCCGLSLEARRHHYCSVLRRRRLLRLLSGSFLCCLGLCQLLRSPLSDVGRVRSRNMRW